MIKLAYSKPQIRIHSAVMQYVRGECDRQKMMDTISGEMAREGVYKIKVGNYYVRQLPPITTSVGEFNVVHFDAPYGVFDHCPTCGDEDEWGHIAGEAPTVQVMCMECGTYYERRVQSETLSQGG